MSTPTHLPPETTGLDGKTYPAQRGAECSVAELADRIRKPTDQVEGFLRDWEAMGLVEEPEEGMFRLTDEGWRIAAGLP